MPREMTNTPPTPKVVDLNSPHIPHTVGAEGRNEQEPGCYSGGGKSTRGSRY